MVKSFGKDSMAFGRSGTIFLYTFFSYYILINYIECNRFNYEIRFRNNQVFKKNFMFIMQYVEAINK